MTEDRLKEIEQHTADEYTGFATAQHIHELIAEVRRLREEHKRLEIEYQAIADEYFAYQKINL